jgi:GNAT superfamily N-acetyltransferase
MTESAWHLRTLTPRDVDEAIEWAASEGWNPGLNDRHCFMATDPCGFLGGFLDDEMVATISVVKYGRDFGFLGFYIVRPDFRGQGYGLRTWNAGLEYLNGRNIGLDGVVDQQENYRKSGFKLAYRNIRYQGEGGGEAPMDPSIVNLDSMPVQAVVDYDREFFPDDRTAFVQCWIQQPGIHALGIVNDGLLAGYGVIRPCLEGFKIGPLFAESGTLARLLFRALCSRVDSDQPVFLDTPESNPDAVALARENRMIRVFETARMYSRETPALPLQKIFGVTTFELG